MHLRSGNVGIAWIWCSKRYSAFIDLKWTYSRLNIILPMSPDNPRGVCRLKYRPFIIHGPILHESELHVQSLILSSLIFMQRIGALSSPIGPLEGANNGPAVVHKSLKISEISRREGAQTTIKHDPKRGQPYVVGYGTLWAHFQLVFCIPCLRGLLPLQFFSFSPILLAIFSAKSGLINITTTIYPTIKPIQI